jgi:hypothetical protein
MARIELQRELHGIEAIYDIALNEANSFVELSDERSTRWPSSQVKHLNTCTESGSINVTS